ncbi:MAG: hypothetical protein HC795_02725 [Coleofasciculaceae cyanobacterium RL_1_1]|nr:hypothetical protein [Coleofasciculaceae cyanobacterium RL_1_1]
MPVSPPTVSLFAPSEAKYHGTFDFTVSFDNPEPDASGNVGYGPFFDLLIPPDGLDGSVPENGDYIGLTIKPYEGKTYRWSAATESWVDNSSGAVQITHPLLRPDSEPTIPDPYPLSVPDGTGLADGTLWRAYQLPFGSFTPEQPEMEITFKGVTLDDTSAELQVRGGYIFGDSPTGSTPVVSGVDSTTTEPRIYSFSKSSNAKEGETATGKNFPVEYTLSVSIDPDVAIKGLVIEDILPAEFQFLSYTLPSLSGVTITPNVPAALTTGAGGDSSGTVDLADVDFDDSAMMQRRKRCNLQLMLMQMLRVRRSISNTRFMFQKRMTGIVQKSQTRS